MLLGQELKFKNKLCNLKLGTFFSALPGLGAFGPPSPFQLYSSHQFLLQLARIGYIFQPLSFKRFKKTVITVYEFPLWELSFILFFVSLHRVTQIRTLLPTLEAPRQKQ